jgi:hypothetical protein
MNPSVFSIVRGVAVAVVFGLVVEAGKAQQPVAKASDNLLKNASFDNGTEGWVLSAAHKNGKMAIDEEVKHGNKPSLRVENPQGDDTFVRQKVTVKPNMKYRLTGYIKTKDVMETKRNGKNGASIALGNGSFVKTEIVNKTTSWSRVSVDFSTGNETEIELGPRIGHFGAMVMGTAWFADLTLDEQGKTSKQR